MRAFFATALLELRAAARSKSVLMLTAFSAVWTLALPHFLVDDGTAQGAFALRVRYTLGPVFAVTLAAVSVAAAGSLSRERAAKRLQLAMVRPARRFTLALARIAALVVVAAASIGVSCAIVAVREGPGRECSHVLSPVLTDAREEALARYREYCANVPGFEQEAKNAGEGIVVDYLERYVRDEYQTVRPGESATWRFSDPGTQDGLAVRVMMTDLFGRLENIGGVFRFESREGTLEHVNKTLVAVPLDRAATGPAAAGELSFRNDGKMDVSFQPRRDLKLLASAGPLAANAFRACIAAVAVVAFAVSLGMFLGSCLGRGTAVFCVLAILAASVVSPASSEHTGDPLQASALERFSLKVANFASAATKPLDKYSPVSALASDECVEWSETARAAFGGFVLYPLVFSLLAGFAMSRKSDL